MAFSCLSLSLWEQDVEKSAQRWLDGHLALGSLEPWQRSSDTSLNCSEHQFTHSLKKKKLQVQPCRVVGKIKQSSS